MLKINTATSRGFTIVELLIVIVVIAILAAITIVAYNGIQNRATNSQVTAGVRTYITAIQQYATLNSSYPSHLGCLGAGYPGNQCWAGTSGNISVNASLDTQISQVLTSKPTLATSRFSIGIGDNMRAGAMYQNSGGERIIYYLKGTDQPCLPGSTSANEGGLVTQCVYRFANL
ncbi:prepilin-type N-terminal cleavage/methylation domain-containing protein [Candidatus Saccharibacteria bacterium]|nr:prepilin-type N-terminal cleavage/methylation domain-containing protein [Candidatus Saccharibacteria bacterium]